MLQQYCPSLTEYIRLKTREVKIGNLAIGNGLPILIQTMTTTDTMDTEATVAQSIRCIEAGAELVRITAPSKNEAENLLNIKKQLRARGYDTPLVADIHFTPNAAEIAARIVEKVRVNPGNYIDKKKFDFIDYTDAEYMAEVDRIRDRFTPLVRICKEYGTAMRIGTNHGSLSDRIMSRYGDTPIGMVESAMEFLRIARGESYHQVVLSMKSSNPIVMVQAYRLLVQKMDEEFGECYPLHLGVTEAGDGAEGRIKSAIGIGSLLGDGIGDTIRVSLTEDPEFEIPVCKDMVEQYAIPDTRYGGQFYQSKFDPQALPYSPFSYRRRETIAVRNIGGHNVPVVVGYYLGYGDAIEATELEAIGYKYNADDDKWNISDSAADYIYIGDSKLSFALPGTLQVICEYSDWKKALDKSKYHPFLTIKQYLTYWHKSESLHFIKVFLNGESDFTQLFAKLKKDTTAVLIISEASKNTMARIRRFFIELMMLDIKCPVILEEETLGGNFDKQLINLAADMGGLLLDGMGDGLMLYGNWLVMEKPQEKGRTHLEVNNFKQFLNNTAFYILQAARTRISKTEYISCPSCGRTLFDLQETTARIRAATNHLKGVKIAIMGCIVNGPGEMADADFGYVGSGPGKITLYKGKDIMKRNVPSDIAVDELINLLKEHDAWVEL